MSVAVFGFAKSASAGFGISPPYIKNTQLTPGSKYEQTIVLLRSSSDDDLRATVKINASEIASWITIDKGTEFILPKGEVQVPMKVMINVPESAEIGSYKGNLNIKIAAANPAQKSGVAIALGARLDIDLALTNVANSDFIVRVASIPDFELLKWPWNYKIFSIFLHRVRVVLNIENIGNVPTAPSKVSLELFDITKAKQLESSVDKSLEEVEAFSTKEIAAFFPTKLGAGQYWGRVKIYKDSNIVNSYEIAFTIAKPGELGGRNPSLGLYPWLLLAAYALAALLVLVILVKVKIWRLAAQLLLLVLGLLAHPLRLLGSAFNLFKMGFWRWLARAASKYNDDDRRGG